MGLGVVVWLLMWSVALVTGVFFVAECSVVVMDTVCVVGGMVVCDTTEMEKEQNVFDV